MSFSGKSCDGSTFSDRFVWSDVVLFTTELNRIEEGRTTDTNSFSFSVESLRVYLLSH